VEGTFDLFPKSDTEFYLKVVNAQLVFNKNDAGVKSDISHHRGSFLIYGKCILDRWPV
jgi:hypothetical protein